MNLISHRNILLNILLFSAGIFLFARFIHGTNWLQKVAMAALLLPCIAFYRHAVSSSGNLFTIHPYRQKYFAAMMLTGLVLGAGAGVYYRISIGSTPFPMQFTWFSLTAIGIGMAEELIFRGAAYSIIGKWPGYLTISITAFLHASYKTVLFLHPNLSHPVDLPFLFTTTFIAGLVLGYIRYTGQSVVPVAVSHGLWDAIVYGDSSTPPWWVW